jgi:hypothetical protein
MNLPMPWLPVAARLPVLVLFVSMVACSSCQQAEDPAQAGAVASTSQSESGAVQDGGSVAEAGTPEQASGGQVETVFRFEDDTGGGLGFTHVAGRSPEKFMPESMGGGVIIADFNRDASPDVLFLNSGRFDSNSDVNPAVHQLFINDGKGTFIDRTSAWKLGNPGYGMGGAVGDFDNDGWADLYLTTYDGTDRLLRNTGTSFVDVTQASGLTGDGRWSTSAGFFDMDLDGDLDLYVVKYVVYSRDTAIPCYQRGYQVYCTPVMFEPLPDRLYRNNGDGTFTDVSESAGIPTNGKGLALAIGDIDLDGDSDLYVANDSTANFLLINDGSGKFEDKAGWLGVAYNSFGKEEAGMGVDFSDVNDDGLSDIVCTNFQSETTSLYVQQPKGFFIERSAGLGIGQTTRLRLSWGIDFFDADNDGDEDLLMANGHIDTDIHKYQTGVSFAQLNTLYEKRDGRFRDVTGGAGPALKSMQPSRGLATGDLDSDGDIDFIVVNNNTDAQVAHNVTQPLGNFVTLWLEGSESNRSAIGTAVKANFGGLSIRREVQGASSYLSGPSRLLHLGLGAATRIDELIIHWPGGSNQVIRDLPAGAFYHLIQGRDPVVIEPGENVIAPQVSARTALDSG